MTIVITNTPTSNDSLPTILFDNLFLDGTLSASTETTGYPKENAVSENTNKSWKPTALPANLKVDLGVATSVDSFAVVAHNLGTKGLTASLQSSSDDTTWSTVSVASPSDDTTLLGLFSSLSSRYWRLLISVKNLSFYTEQFDNAVWTKALTTITANAGVAPDGFTTADAMVETTGTGFHSISDTVVCSPSTTYTWSLYVKQVPGGTQRVRLRLADTVGFLNDVVFNFNTGQLVTPGADKGFEAVGNGWYRIWCSATTGAASTSLAPSFFMYQGDTTTLSYTGDGVSSVLLWGAQVELGSVPSGYFKVDAAATGNQPNIGVVMLGQRFNFPAGVKAPYTPVWLSQQYELLTATTLGGQFLGNKVLRQGGRTTINLVSLERNFAESDLTNFRLHYNSGKAFVWAAGPSVFSKDVGYVWRTENSVMAPSFDENGSWMSVSMEVDAYGE